MPTVRIIMPLPVVGRGPAQTCRNIAEPWAAAGHAVKVYTPGRRVPNVHGLYKSSVPGGFYRSLSKSFEAKAAARAERLCLRDLRPGDVLYIWGMVSRDFVRAARDRGAILLREKINNHTRFTKTVLDEASRRIDAPPQHGITDAIIAEDDFVLSHSDYVFCPNAYVEASLAENGVAADKLLPTSYGAHLPATVSEILQQRQRQERLSILFMGTVCVRKGAHRLIEAWLQAKVDGELVLAGGIDPFIASRYGRYFEGHGIRAVGFQTDVGALYSAASVFVFPSLEEGGPQVCYEAAAYGLPQITTGMGGGRIAQDGRNAVIVAPDSADDIAHALVHLAEDKDRRLTLGAAAAADARAYTWDRVAERRYEQVRGILRS